MTPDRTYRWADAARTESGWSDAKAAGDAHTNDLLRTPSEAGSPIRHSPTPIVPPTRPPSNDRPQRESHGKEVHGSAAYAP